MLTYTIATAVDGNGFVASFVCGVIFVYVRGRMVGGTSSPATASPTTATPAPSTGRDFDLLEDITFLLTLVMWFVFGSVAVFAMSLGVDWRVLLFAVAALTVARVAPSFVAMAGSRYTARDRLLLGALGPRGTTSIVFGLLAFNTLRGDIADTVLTTTIVVVLGSVLLHGLMIPAVTHKWPQVSEQDEEEHAAP